MHARTHASTHARTHVRTHARTHAQLARIRRPPTDIRAAIAKLDWDGTELEIKIPPSKIVLGYPATQAAAPVHALPEWETPEGLLALYRSSPELMATRGVMTWSVGHDHSNGWKWIRAVRQIWA